MKYQFHCERRKPILLSSPLFRVNDVVTIRSNLRVNDPLYMLFLYDTNYDYDDDATETTSIDVSLGGNILRISSAQTKQQTFPEVRRSPNNPPHGILDSLTEEGFRVMRYLYYDTFDF